MLSDAKRLAKEGLESGMRVIERVTLGVLVARWLEARLSFLSPRALSSGFLRVARYPGSIVTPRG